MQIWPAAFATSGRPYPYINGHAHMENLYIGICDYAPKPWNVF